MSERFFYSIVPRGRDTLENPLVKSQSSSEIRAMEDAERLKMNDVTHIGMNSWKVVKDGRGSRISDIGPSGEHTERFNKDNNCENCPYLFGKSRAISRNREKNH